MNDCSMGKNWQPLSEDGGADISDLGGEHVPKIDKCHSRLAISQVLEKPVNIQGVLDEYLLLLKVQSASR